jgi:hypothetical protein
MSTSHPTMMGDGPLMPHRLERTNRAGKLFGELRSSRSLEVSALIAAVLLALGVLLVPGPASAAPGDMGTEGPSHAGTGTPTGSKRNESVLWYNDGSWWGNLWDTDSSRFHIFRFNEGTESWVDTGVETEDRANTHHDVLWDGTTLYVASNLFVNDETPAKAGSPSWLRRYSYNATTKTYAPLESSNPNSTPEVNDTQINNFRTETLTIDKDSTGRLWATWQQGNKIYLNVTGTDGNTWGVPFPHPDANVSVDDNSALIAFGPGKMGLMWSSQTAANDGFYWSVHTDGDASTTWSAKEEVRSGSNSGDDHMNLKWLDSSGGRVFAAIKTNFTSSTQPLIELLAMDSTGAWTQHTIARVSECPNRVIVLIDEGAQPQPLLRTFATYPKPAGTTNAGVCTSSGGAIYEKSTPLNNIDFTATTKTARIVDADQYVHNVSSTKQNLTATSGLMVIADVNATSRYWYHFESGSTPPPDTTPPETLINLGPSGTTTSTDASFTFSSSEETGSTFQCMLDDAPYASCTSPKTYTGLTIGSHTFQVRATDLAGNTDQTPASRTWTIAADTTPPETTIDVGPSGTTTNTDASFTFSSSEETGSTFQCMLDDAPYASCTSPKTYTSLTTGSHTFQVRATDAAGNTDASPASRTWTIEAGTPGSGIVRGPVSESVNIGAATTLTILKPANTAQGDVLVSCVSLDGGIVGGVPAGWTPLAEVTALPNPRVYGYYKVATSSEPASYSWTTSSRPSGGSITRYSGASGLDTPAKSATSVTSGPASSGSVQEGVTTTTPNAMLVGCMSVNSSSVTLTSPTGMSQVIETGARRFEFADGIQATAGASGAKTWTFSAARDWAGWLAALRPNAA